MSVIQSIQEKYAKAMAIIIALALIIFVVMLAFENGGSLFHGGNNNVLAKVNGQSINYNTFQKKVEQQENYMKSQGYNDPTQINRQAIDATWNQELDRLLIESEAGKLGLAIGKKELGDILYGANPPADLKRQFTNEAGVYDANLAKQQIDNLLKRGSAEDKTQLNAYISQLEQNRLTEKYTSLLANSTNFPKWMLEKQNAENSQIAKISYVRELYSAIPDSAIKVSDKEIEDYISKHKDQYKQAEETRSISYVAFSALPTATDSTAALNAVTSLKPEFDSTNNAGDFVTRNASAINYADIYVGKSTLQMANMQMGMLFKDTLFSLAKNAVYGPYLDGGAYVLAKMIDSKVLPDSVKARHILIGTIDPQTRQPLIDDSVAHRLADSIAVAIKNGANFDTLETKFSTDKVAHQEKGVMTFSSTDIQGENFAKEFGQFILFDGKPGDKKVVKTSFGWHYIEIMDFIKPEPHYKFAYMARQILPSQETDNAALGEATKFAGDSRDAKSFDANADKLRAKGINKLAEQNLTANSYRLQMGMSRPLVKSVFDAKLGEVLQPERVGDYYVVALVTEINKKGTQSAAKARPMVEPLLRNHKKAEQLIKKAGNASSLEAAATAWGGKQIETADSLRMDPTVPGPLSTEPKVIGASFNPANKGKVTPPIEGTSGVYVIRVENISATPVMSGSIEDQRQSKYLQNKMRNSYPQQALKEAATIKDNRSTFY